MFDPTPAPRVFALPIGSDFSRAFVDGLHARMQGCQPEAWARLTIFVNTRRSARRLTELLSNGPVILPDIRFIGDLSLAPFGQIPLPASPLERQLLLADLVGAFLESQGDLAPKSAMFDLANSLASLLDELAGEGLAIDALEAIVVERLSGHWQRSLTFLNILKDYVTALDKKLSGAEARQRAVIAMLAATWADKPLLDPVIIAGSTGSRATTAMFIKAVASLPQGAVVLPGFDFQTPIEVWPNLSEEHPQFGFANLGKKVEFDPAKMPVWHKVTQLNETRNAFVSLSLRPAPVTAEWLADGPKFIPDLSKDFANITLIEAPNPRLEATAIAIKLRQSVQEGMKSALITPDRLLARRVSALLQRWNIVPDNSAGQPAKLSPPGMLLRMISRNWIAELTPLRLLELLKHPLCAIGERTAHLRLTRRLEVEVLRGGPAFVCRDDLAKWAVENDCQDWANTIISTLFDKKTPQKSSVQVWANFHRNLTESLAAPDIWEQESGRKTLSVLETFSQNNHPTQYTPIEYRALFNSALESQEIRDDPVLAHPDVAIWGTLEARVQSADLVIMAGLNDGVWPQISRNDTWLNRDMRRQIGLQLPERRIGLSAHDYQQSFGANEVVLSRSIRDGEAPTIASRWLMRLQNLMAGLGDIGKTVLGDMQLRGGKLLDYAAQLDAPEHTIPPAKRPAPSPPLDTRPKSLFVTKIETLIRDPYAIYAQYILKLYKFRPLGRQPDHLEKGIVLHDILEQFIRETMDGFPADPEILFERIVSETLQNKIPWPAARRMWRANFLKNSVVFLKSELDRRAIGNPVLLEAKGTRILPGGFQLRARADRIDVDNSGNISIYDYKSGAKVSETQIREYSVQLPLEGVIAESGGFSGISAAKIRCLQVIFLGGDGATVTFNESDSALADVWDKICRVIARFQDIETGYPARLRPELSAFDGDFDHLSRRGEWQDEDGYEVEIL